MIPRTLVWVYLAGCGRVAFDPVADAATDAATDAANLAPPRDLAGLRFTLPCMGVIDPVACLTGPATVQTVQLTGVSSDHYTVTIRVRAATEATVFGGGQAGAGGWYVGGVVLDASDTTNGISVSSPAQHYEINNGPYVTHATAFDYEATFSIDGDALVTFTSDSGDGAQLRNLDATVMPITFPGVVTTPDPYDGTFGYLDVVDVQLR